MIISQFKYAVVWNVAFETPPLHFNFNLPLVGTIFGYS